MISVVLPACNEEKFLPRSLDSLCRQDFGSYEVIVVVNGSTDKTALVARKYPVKILHCEKHSAFYARQIGAEAASGEIIVQADADTIYPPDWLSLIYADFKRQPSAVAVAGVYKYADPPWWAFLEYFLRLVCNTYTRLFHGRPMLISGANFAFKRHVFERIGGYHVSAFSADQYDISTRLSRQGKVLLDRHLIALTSARRVKKPFLRILRDVFKNIAMVTGWVLEHISQFFRSLYRSPSFFHSVKNTLPILGLVGILFWGYASPSSQLFGNVYFEGDGQGKNIALTFEDGPSPEYTSAILDILDKYNIKATFFVVGKQVEVYPELTREILERGHILGNHSYSHDANHALSDFGSKDMLRCAEVICQYTGITPCLYRPPYGKSSPWELAATKEMNMITVNWSYAVEGDSLAGTDNAVSKILDEINPGCILLLHDGYGIDSNSFESDCQLTLKVLDSLISNLLKQGYNFVTVPVLLGTNAYS